MGQESARGGAASGFLSLPPPSPEDRSLEVSPGSANCLRAIGPGQPRAIYSPSFSLFLCLYYPV